MTRLCKRDVVGVVGNPPEDHGDYLDTSNKSASKTLGVRSRCDAAAVAQRRIFDDDGHEGQSPQDQAAHGEIK